MSKFKRFIAGLMVLVLVLGEIPAAAFAQRIGESNPYTMTLLSTPEDEEPGIDGGEAGFDINTTEGYLLSIMQDLVKVSSVTAVTSRPGQSVEDVGRIFHYNGTVSFHNIVMWNYKDPDAPTEDTGSSTRLFLTYDNVVVKVRPDSRITLCEENGTPLAVDADGWYTIPADMVPSVVAAPPTGNTNKNFSVYAKMNGNGSTCTSSYDELEVAVTYSVSVCSTFEGYDEPAPINLGPDSILVNNSSAMTGIGEGDWTVRKSPASSPVSYSKAGHTVKVRYTLEAGRDSAGQPDGQNNAYVEYGVISLDTATIIDTIAAVQDKDGVDRLPVSVIVTPSTGVAVAADNSSITITDAGFNTLDGSAYGLGTVKSYTSYTVELTYNSDWFTWAMTDATCDDDFDFVDNASISYTLKDGTFDTGADDAVVSWHTVAGGGNVAINQHLFLKADASNSILYSDFYRLLFNSNVTYKLYKADESGTIIPEGNPGAWSMELSLDSDYSNKNGRVETINNLENKVPVGKIVIVPQFDAIDTGILTLTDEYNTAMSAVQPVVVNVAEGATAEADFFMRYKDGGFVHAAKHFYRVDGTEITGTEARSLFSQTSFELKNTVTGAVTTLSLGADGEGNIAIPIGTYDVKETTTSAYIPYVSQITVAEGETVEICPDAAGGSKIVNMPAKALLQVSGKKADQWVDGNYTKTKSGAASYTDADQTYKVQKNVNGTWTDVAGASIDLSNATTDIYLDRYDSDGNLIEYRLVATSSDLSERSGSVLDASNAGMSDDAESVSFTFPDTAMIRKIEEYYLRYVNVKVVKVVDDPRSTPASPAGWSIKLTSSADSAYAETLTTVAVDATKGEAVFEHLPKTDASGEYITYTAEELGLDPAVWTVSYNPSSASAKADSASEKTITVTNRFRRSTVKIVKKDADDHDILLAGAKYKLYILDGGVKKYVTDTMDSNGLRTFTTSEADAAEFITGTYGVATCDNLPAGYSWYAHETEAPEFYYLATEDLSIGTVDASPVEIEALDHHMPTIKVEKTLYNMQGTKKSCPASASGAVCKFELYIKDASGSIVPVLAANGSPVTFSVTTVSGAASAFSQEVVVEKYGEYYLLETQTQKGIMKPEQGRVKASVQSYTERDGRIFFGPYQLNESTSGAAVTATFTAADRFGVSIYSWQKKDLLTGQTVSNASLTYRFMALCPDDEDKTFNLMKARNNPFGWTKTKPSGLDDVDLPAPTGYYWVYSGNLTSKGQEMSWGDWSGDPLTMYAIEMTPPAGYYNKLNDDGSIGHNVSPVVYSAPDANGNVKMSFTFEDLPVRTLSIDKQLFNVWWMDVSYPYYIPMNGAEFTLYELDENDKLIRLVETGTTTNDPTPGWLEFDAPLDARKSYVVVETNTNGKDPLYNAGVTGRSYGTMQVAPAALVGNTLGGLDTLEVNYRVCRPTDWAGGSQSYSMSNYWPYFQILLNKSGVDEEGTVITQHLDLAQYVCYTISKSVFAEYGNDPATVIANGKAVTDEYIYETGSFAPGQFKTNAFDYYSDTVYIFEETEVPTGYEAIGDYVVVTPDMYQNDITAKNGTYFVEDKNLYVGGSGGGSLRRIRVELDKVVDKNDNMVYDENDDDLANVTFDLNLLDKSGNVVVCPALTTFFTTGLSAAEPSHGTSVTMKLTYATLAALVTAGYDPDDIFDFTYDGNPSDYAEYLANSSDWGLFEYHFDMLLTESEFPDKTTPYKLKYIVHFDTDVSDMDDSAQCTVNREYMKDNPILNSKGAYVLAEARKLVNGGLWMPANADDYVKIWIRATDVPENPPEDFISEAEVVIDSSNYDDLPLIRLYPETRYAAREDHSPEGYDKPLNNYVIFTTGKLETRTSSDPDVRIKKINLVDTPYIQITAEKVDSAGAPVAGAKLKLVYKGKESTAIKDPNGNNLPDDGSLYSFVHTTGADGKAVFTVPKYDYSINTNWGNNYTAAAYNLVEVNADGTKNTQFELLNGAAVVDVQNKTGVIKVVNPETMDLDVYKQVMTSAYAAVPGAQFELYYRPYDSVSNFTATSAPTCPGMGTSYRIYSGLTDDDGYIHFTDLKSGWYELIETIPAEYVNGGKTYEIWFNIVTLGDAASMLIANPDYASKGYYWLNGKNVVVCVKRVKNSDGSYTTNPDSNNAVADNTAEPKLLTVSNTSKGYLNIVKVFEPSDLASFPANVKVYIYKDNRTSGTVAEYVLTVDAATGKASVLDTNGAYVALEPGEYNIAEGSTLNAAWFATGKVEGSTDASKNLAETYIAGASTDGRCFSALPKKITVTAANTEESPVIVTFTNRSGKFGLKASKVNDRTPAEPIEGAEFVVLYKNNNKEYFYTTSMSVGTGLYVWSTDATKAVHFTTDEDGILDISLVASSGWLDLCTVPAYEGDFILREVKADEKAREIMEDKTVHLKMGEVLDLTEDEPFVDGSGLSVDLTLIGRTFAHVQEDGNAPKISGVLFKLYKQNADGSLTLVSSYDENGSVITDSMTDTNGHGCFYYLDMIGAGEKYILVQEAVKDGYNDLDIYTSASIGATELAGTEVTVGGKTVTGYVLFDGNNIPADKHSVSVDVYNMPVAGLVVLKYDINYPLEQIPENAAFSVELLIDPDNPYHKTLINPVTYTGSAKTTVAALAATRAHLVDGRIEGYTYNAASGKYTFSDAGHFYSFFDKTGLIPGTYRITETGKPTNNYLYTPKAEEGDPWYTVREVTVDDDGGIAVTSFANIPDPNLNPLSIEKTVTATEGTGEEGKLGNLQETLESGERQSISYSISNFAPCKEKVGTATVTPEFVRYPMTSLEVRDIGQNFFAKTVDISDQVESIVTSVTVGKANYVPGDGIAAASSMPVAVFGLTGASDTTGTYIATVDVASAASQPVVLGAPYTGFRLVYNADASHNAQPLLARFHADSVLTTYTMLQSADDEDAPLANNVRNSASVTMGYDIGLADADKIEYTVETYVDAPADTAIKLPPASIAKAIAVSDTDLDDYVKKIGDVGYHTEQYVLYTLTFTNEQDPDDDPLVIPDPFIFDNMPPAFDVLDAVPVDLPEGMTFDEPTSVFNAETGNYQVYMFTHGDLQPGDSIKLQIKARVNTARALEADNFDNTVYGSSSKIIAKNKDNPYGCPFTAEAGAAPARIIPNTSLNDKAAISATRKGHLESYGTLTIMKMVAGDVTGANKWMSGDDIAVTTSGGNVYYKIVVRSTAPIAAGGLRIVDLFPQANNDRSIENMNRAPNGTSFHVFEPSALSIKDADGNNVRYEILYSTSVTPSTYKTPLTHNGTDNLTFMPTASSWSSTSATANGFFIHILDYVNADSPITILYTMKAPAGAEIDSASGTITYNYYKNAVNNAAAWSVNDTADHSNSNDCSVTMTPNIKAGFGDYVWLDKDADGIQDSGEDVFKGVSYLQYRTYKNSDSRFSTSERIPLTEGTYWVGGLEAAIVKSASTSPYDSNGNVNYSKLNGNTRYTYQVVVPGSAIPDGYVVTKAYAGKGAPTTFDVHVLSAVRKSDNLPVFDAAATAANNPGYMVDNDFAHDAKSDLYVSRRFYLPIDLEDDDLKNPSTYPNFDLGVVRIRDLDITKKGNDDLPVEGAIFSVYGPYDSQPDFSAFDESTANKVVTIETGSDGVASFESDFNLFINWYQYYVIVEESVPAPYAKSIVSVSATSGDIIYDASVRDDAFILTPADDEAEARTEDVTVVDPYTTEGSFDVSVLKVLEGASINDPLFSRRFNFELSSTDDPFLTTPAVITNDGKDAKATLTFVYDEPVPAEGITYSYKLVELPGDDYEGLGYDPAECTFSLVITDPDHDGTLTVERINLKKDGVDFTGAVTFTNEVYKGNLKIEKTVQGKASSPDDSFEFTITLTPEKDFGALIYGKTFSIEGNTGVTSVTFTKDTASTADPAPAVGKVTLKQDQYLTIKGLPAGTVYAIEEADYSSKGYEIISGGSGTIEYDKTAGEPKTAEFTAENIRKVGSLSVTKTLSGDGTEPTRQFHVTVTLTNPDGVDVSGTYDAEIRNGSALVSGTTITFNKGTKAGTAVGEFNLQGGRTFIIKDILAGTDYLVEEDDYGYLAYSTTYSGENDTVTVDGASAEIINTRAKGSGITLKKVTAGAGKDKRSNFDFVVTFTYPDTINLDESINRPSVENGTMTWDNAKHTVTVTATLTAGGDVLSIEDVMKGVTYEIEETDYSSEGYLTVDYTMNGAAQSDMHKASGTVTDDTAAYTWVCTNTREVGDLSLSKVLAGAGTEADSEENREFDFVVTLSRTDDFDVAGTYVTELTEGTTKTAGTITFAKKDGVVQASVKLKGGQILTIKDILAGTSYTVKEADYSALAYKTVSEGETGPITDGTVAEAEFTNTREIGSLNLTKELTGSGIDVVKDYRFTITLDYTNALTGKEVVDLTKAENKPVFTEIYTTGARAIVESVNTNGQVVTAAVTLEKDAKISVTNILKGVAYTIVENDYTTLGYAEPAIDGADSASAWTASGSIASDEQSVAVTYENKRETGTLSVEKILSGAGTGTDSEQAREFEFTVTLTRDDMVAINTEHPAVKTTSAGSTDTKAAFTGTASEASCTFKLKGGEKFLIKDIPVGTVYTVTEGDYTAYGYTTAKENDSDVISLTASEAKFTNTREIGCLKVNKKFTGTGRDILKQFSFIVVLAYDSTIDLSKTENMPVVATAPGVTGVSSDVNAEKKTVTINATVATNATLSISNILEGILKDTTYTVTEADCSEQGYGVPSITGADTASGWVASGTITDDEQTVSVTYTNTRDAGGLAVAKILAGSGTVADSEQNRVFDLTVELTRDDVVAVNNTYPVVKYLADGSEDKSLTSVSFTGSAAKASATLSLKGGERVVFSDIPLGTAYAVTEDDYTEYGYVSTAANESGTVSAAGSTATYTNTREIGSLDLTKELTGTGIDVVKDYRFTITLDYANATTDTAIDLTKAENKPVFTAGTGAVVESVSTNGQVVTAVVTLKKNAKVSITNILKGVVYTIVENDYTTLGYAEPAIDGADSASAWTASGSIASDEQSIAVTYENKRETGTLSVEKILSGAGTGADSEKAREFEFTVTLTRDDTVAINTEYPAVKTTSAGSTDTKAAFTGTASEASYTFKLKGGEKLLIKDIPVGTVYTVTEGNYTSYGYTTTKTGDSGNISATASEAEFTNTREIGSLDLTKVLTGTGEDVVVDYRFTITLDYDKATTDKAIDLTKAENKPVITAGTGVVVESVSTNGQIVTAVVTLKKNAKVSITNILKGVAYTIVENDYTTLGYSVPEIAGADASTAWSASGAIANDEQSVSVAYKNTREAGGLSVEKILSGAGTEADSEKAREFEFTVTLTRDDMVAINTEYPAVKATSSGSTDTTVTFSGTASEASYTFKLKGGEKLSIADIPVNTVYTVTEGDYTAFGYTTAKENDSGTVTAAASTAKFTNAREIGSLALTKELTGTGEDIVIDYNFTITLDYTKATANKDIDLTKDENKPVFTAGNGASVKSVTTSGKVVTAVVMLKANATVDVTNILKGVAYTVVETDYTSLGYSKPVITGADESDGWSATGTIAEDKQSIAVKYENERETGSLSVEKLLSGSAVGTDAEKNRDFTFTVKLTRTDTVAINSEYPAVKTTASGSSDLKVIFTGSASEASYTFTLKGDEKLVINDIPLGTHYAVTEGDYESLGYVTVEKVTEGDVAAGTNEVSVTNTREKGKLIVHKKFDGNGRDILGKFDFVVVLTYDDQIDLAKSENVPAVVKADGVTDVSRNVNGNIVTINATVATDATLTIEDIITAAGTGVFEPTAYTVTEADYTAEAYLTTDIDGTEYSGDQRIAFGTIDVNGTAEAEHTFTNIRKTGTLDVSKLLAGSAVDGRETETGREFEFTVTFSRKDGVAVNVSYPAVYTTKNGEQKLDVTFDGTAEEAAYTFKILAGEDFLIKDIPLGTDYLVEEGDYTAYGYAAEIEGAEGTITEAESDAEAVCTNTREMGKLIVHKKFEGSGRDILGKFVFTVVFTYDGKINLKAAENLPKVIDADGITDVSMNVDGNTVIITATVATDATLTIEDILTAAGTVVFEPTAYTVSEDDYTAWYYLVTDIDGTEFSGEERIASGTIDVNTTAEAEHTFTNKRDTGNLQVLKTIAGNAAESDHAFNFTVTLTRTDDIPVNGEYPAVYTMADGTEEKLMLNFTGSASEASCSFELFGGETMLITDIPGDTAYLVHEDDYQTDGYLTDGNDAEGVIVNNETAEEEIINNRNKGDIIIEKNLEGNAADYLPDFEFTMTLTRTDNLPVALTYTTGENADGRITFEAAGDRTAKATFRVNGGESFRINGIYTDTEYTVTETDYGKDGYKTTFENETGIIGADEAVMVVCTNERNTGELTVTKTVVADGMNIPVDRVFEFTVSLKLPSGGAYNGTLRMKTPEGKTTSITFRGGEAVIRLKHGESATIYDILVNSTYEVTEKYYPDVIVNGTGTIGTISRTASFADFVNELQQEYIDLTIVKKFKGENIKMPDHIDVQILNRDGVVGTYTITETDGWMLTVKELPKYDADGNEYVYSVIEIGGSDYFRVIYSTEDGAVVITNIPLEPGAGIPLNEGYCFD